MVAIRPLLLKNFDPGLRDIDERLAELVYQSEQPDRHEVSLHLDLGQNHGYTHRSLQRAAHCEDEIEVRPIQCLMSCGSYSSAD